MSNVPRRTRTKAQRLRDELQRASTEELIAHIESTVERDWSEYKRSGRAARDRRRRQQLEQQERGE